MKRHGVSNVPHRPGQPEMRARLQSISQSRTLHRHHPILALQQQIGNRGAARLVDENNPYLQRKLAVDPARFTGTKSTEKFEKFKQMILNELKAVTGLDLEFSANLLEDKSKKTVKLVSQTAAKVLKMALRPAKKIFIDPLQKTGGAPTARGIEISTASVPMKLKAMRTGIVIIHELAHRFASSLKPPNYDKRMKSIEQKAKNKGALTPEEAELLFFYRPVHIEADENIPVSVANEIRKEMGLIERTHYGFHIEFPKKVGKTGLDKFTTYSQFKISSSPPVYIYLEVGNWDLYSSSKDYFKELLKKGHPPAPNASEFKKINKGTKAYQAIKGHLE